MPSASSGGRGVGAPRRFSGHTAAALAAAHHETRHDAVAHPYLPSIRTDGLDHACTLVAEDHRTRALQRAVEVVVVAVTQPDRNRPDEDLAADGLVVLDIDDVEHVRSLAEHSGAHGASVCATSSGPGPAQVSQIPGRGDLLPARRPAVPRTGVRQVKLVA